MAEKETKLKIIIEAVATGAQKTVGAIKTALNKLGGKQKLDLDNSKLDETKVKADKLAAAAKGAANELKKIDRPTTKSDSQLSKLSQKATDVAKKFSQAGAMMRVVAGGAVMSIINSAKQIIAHFINKAQKKVKAFAQIANANVANSDYIAQMNSRSRDEDNKWLSELRALENNGALTDVGRERAAQLIANLARQHENLGIAVDATTGKITGLDAAIEKLGGAHHAQQISELEDKLRNLDRAIAAEEKVIARRGSGYLGEAENIISGGSIEADAQAAGTTRDNLLNQRRLLEMDLAALSDSAPGEERRRAADAVLKAAKEGIRLQELINSGKKEEAELERFIAEQKRAGTPLTTAELERLFAFNQQLAALSELHGKNLAADNYYEEMIRHEEHLLELQKLRNAGLEDEAREREFIEELRRRGVDITDPRAALIRSMQEERRALDRPITTPSIALRETAPMSDKLAQIGMYNFGTYEQSNLAREQLSELKAVNRTLEDIYTTIRDGSSVATLS